MSDIRRRPAPPSGYSQTIQRAVPTPAPPAQDQKSRSYITEPRTFITQPGKVSQIVPATQDWVRVWLTLETAGPVEVSASAQWQFLSGSGQALIQNVPMPFTIARGNNLFVQSGAVNRVKFTIEPFPWLEQITGSVQGGFEKLATAFATLVASIVARRKGA